MFCGLDRVFEALDVSSNVVVCGLEWVFETLDVDSLEAYIEYSRFLYYAVLVVVKGCSGI